MTAATLTTPHTTPHQMDLDLRALVDAVAEGNDVELNRRRSALIRNLVTLMVAADLAGRGRVAQALRPRQFAEEATVRVQWGRGMPEAVRDMTLRFPEIADDADQVAQLYLTRPDAFSVAGVAVDDMLARIQGMLVMAIARGEGVENFKDAAAEVTDLSRPRLETVFRTNVATAYAAGRASAAMRHDEIVGFKRVTTRDSATRRNHDAARGQVYSKNDPSLGWFLLPWGYNCRCTDVPVTRRQARRAGMDFTRGSDRLVTPTWPANAFPDPGFEQSGIASIYGI